MPQIGVKAGQADRPPRRRARRRPRVESGLSRALGERSYRAPAVRAVQRSAPRNQARAPRSVQTPAARRYVARQRSAPARYARQRAHFSRAEYQAFSREAKQHGAINSLRGFGSLQHPGLPLAHLIAFADFASTAQQREASLNKLAAHDYLGYVNDLWKRARGYYSTLEAKPNNTVGRTDKQGDALTYSENQKVRYDPGFARAWEGKGTSRAYSEAVPLHEWAHVAQMQRPGAYAHSLPRWVIEGGAEAYKQYVAGKLGIPKTTAPGYGRYTRDVMRRRGRQYALTAQFK